MRTPLHHPLRRDVTRKLTHSMTSSEGKGTWKLMVTLRLVEMVQGSGANTSSGCCVEVASGSHIAKAARSSQPLLIKFRGAIISSDFV